MQAFLHRAGNHRGQHRLSKALTQLLKKFPILCLLNAFAGCAQQLYPALSENTLLFQLHGKIQSGLSANSGDDSIRALKADNLCHIFQRQRFHIDLIRNCRIRHNGCRIGVTEDDLIAFLLQGEAGLRACIVKFRCLSNDDGAGADNQYLLYVSSFRHSCFPPSS